MSEKQQESLYEVACKENPREMSWIAESAFNKVVAFCVRRMDAGLPLAAIDIDLASTVVIQTTGDLGEIEQYNQVAFVTAAANGDLEKVMRMAMDANVNDLKMALQDAVRGNHCPVIDFLINSHTSIPHNLAMGMASSYGRTDALKLFSAKYDLNDFQSFHEATLLTIALSLALHDSIITVADNKEMLVFLIESCGMDINHQPTDGRTVMHKLLLKERINPACAEEIIFILKYRPNLELKDSKGVSAMDLLKDLTNERLISLTNELSAEGEGAAPR